MQKTLETPAKCSNCAGPHPANYIKCPTYLRKLQQREKLSHQRNPNKPAYVPAPPPSTNAWQTRKEAMPPTARNAYKEQYSPMNRRQNEENSPSSQATINKSVSANDSAGATN
ncbi:hypothetical protein CBL_21119, partial [Carabus blaptoides fortunei]